MGSNDEKPPELVYDLKLSSVVPASITRESKTSHNLKNIDLIMKFHYVKGVYFFNKDAAHGFRIWDFKEPMNLCLPFFYHVAGRIRIRNDNDADADADADGGGVFIKCNDGGVRIVEAKCCKTLDQWLLDPIDDDMLVHHHHALGPDFEFSPLVFLQFTWFKCGGISIGLSWAHILGNAFTATQFINLWGHFMAGNPLPSENLLVAGTGIRKSTSSVAQTTLLHSIKQINPVEGQWVVSNDRKMKVRSINVTAKQLNSLVSKISDKVELKPFEVISALVWKYLAKIRGVNEPSIVTICRNDTSCKRSSEIRCNSQVITTVKAGGLKVAEADLLELAELIAKKQVNESIMIESVERSKSDFILYGANLTFVDLEDAQMYDMELKGHKPVFANYWLSGVGDEGTIMVLPAREEGGRVVNLILPESDVEKLQHRLRNQLGIF